MISDRPLAARAFHADKRHARQIAWRRHDLAARGAGPYGVPHAGEW
jgi:hypothetical protein